MGASNSISKEELKEAELNQEELEETTLY